MEPTPVTITLEQKQKIKKLRKMLLSKPCGSERVHQYLYIYASWQHWYSPRKYKLIHLVAISIWLRSMYVHIYPVVTLIVTFKMNLYAQWLSEYGDNWDLCTTPSGNINTVSRNIHTPMAVSLHTASGNINTVPEIINSYTQRLVAILTYS